MGTTALAVLLMGWGAAHAGVGRSPEAGPGGRAPAVVPVRVAVLDP